MEHLMIDLETLGRTPSAPIIAIGAVFFDPNTGNVGAGYQTHIEFNSACKLRTPDPDTIKWWLRQSDVARSTVTQGVTAMDWALADFGSFIEGNRKGVKVWGNGATFDISMLEDAYRQYNIRCPWNFWNVRDVRTVVELAYPQVKKDAFAFEGVAHRALDDAKHQARYVSAMWQYLRGGRQ